MATRNRNLLPFPIDVSTVDAQHLALTTACFERADDPVVHRPADVLVFSAVHLGACGEQRLLLLLSDSSVAFGFLLDLDAHTESMERRCGQVRRVLEPAPIDRRAKRAQCPVDGCDFPT